MFRTLILIILASKKAKNQISWSENWYHRQQKCFRNPFFRHFEPQKGYGRVCHGNIGKVTRVELFRIIIFRSNCHFYAGGGTGVGLRKNEFNFQVFLEPVNLAFLCYIMWAMSYEQIFVLEPQKMFSNFWRQKVAKIVLK